MARNVNHESELSETIDALKDDMRRFKDDIRAIVTDMSHASKEGLLAAREKIREGATRGKEEVTEHLKHAKELGTEKLASIEENIKAHPFMTALAALGVGAIVGRFFRR